MRESIPKKGIQKIQTFREGINMANKRTRPLTMEEYKDVMECIINGFEYTENGKIKMFRPNYQLYIALALESNLGLRISDIKRLTLNNFKNGKLEITEKKTGKQQYRNVNAAIINLVQSYVIEKRLRMDEELIKVTDTAIQKQLRIVCKHLNLDNISTHSFRKLYATTQYENNNNNIELVKELLNHSSIATTQKYIRVSQEQIDKASQEFFIL